MSQFFFLIRTAKQWCKPLDKKCLNSTRQLINYQLELTMRLISEVLSLFLYIEDGYITDDGNLKPFPFMFYMLGIQVAL